MNSDVRYQICVRCVMDTTDENIVFDESGICNHCKLIMDRRDNYWLPDERGERKLNALLSEMKLRGQGKAYDCVLGVSGGVDSSYLLMKAHEEWGLKVLAIHVDAGWNSELAVKNIELMITKLGIDLHTVVVDWEQMKDLQVAFLRAGVPNQDIPQDHAFYAALYKETARQRIPFVLTGSNYATESILPSAWGYSAGDLTHIRAIHRRFGKRRLTKFPLMGFWYFNFYLPKLLGVRIVAPLDLMPFSKRSAIEELERRFGWRYYGGKHYESRFTKFFQGYYLPTRFGFDKRRAHLASLVASGEMTRDQALAELQQPSYFAEDITRDRAFVLKKLELSEAEFEKLLRAPIQAHRAYPTNEWMHKVRWASSFRERIGILREHLGF
jgi:N-acetyl sugar amidotransferase